MPWAETRSVLAFVQAIPGKRMQKLHAVCGKHPANSMLHTAPGMRSHERSISNLKEPGITDVAAPGRRQVEHLLPPAARSSCEQLGRI